jgi:glycosyltransferase involved in cell wall biosynthesis
MAGVHAVEDNAPGAAIGATMHVAVDAHNLIADNRGIGRYARAVLSRALREPGITWTLVVRRFFPNRAGLAAAVGGAPFRIARTVPRDADVVWFPWNGTFLDTTAPSVATIHDCTPFAYPASDPRRRATEQGPFERTAATAVRIMTQSHYTATEVRRWLGVDPARITVTPLAADPAFTPGALDALPPAVRERPFVLCVGAHDERKNTPTLIAAFARAFAAGEMTLVFTRTPAALPRDAIVVDARDDRTLGALYRAATLVAVPSLSEGFGLPLLEALACGAPAVASRTSALPEVGGDAAVWVDDPLDVAGWARALRDVAGDAALRAGLAAAGPVQAATFSWERCTAQTLDVLRDAAQA